MPRRSYILKTKLWLSSGKLCEWMDTSCLFCLLKGACQQGMLHWFKDTLLSHTAKKKLWYVYMLDSLDSLDTA